MYMFICMYVCRMYIYIGIFGVYIYMNVNDDQIIFSLVIDQKRTGTINYDKTMVLLAEMTAYFARCGSNFFY